MMSTTALVPIGDIERMAVAVAESRMFGVATPQQAMALMLIAQAEGMHPAIAARDFHVINGRPSLKADAMMARFQASGGKVQWHEYTDERVIATFTHPAGGELTVDWDMGRAEKAGLVKDNWKKYPRQMLKARVISEGIRALFPGVVAGFYTPEEVQDFEPKKDPIVINPEPPPEPPADDLITAITELAGMMDVDMAPSECLAKLTNNKYTSMHQVRTMPKAHRDKLAAKVGAEKEALTP